MMRRLQGYSYLWLSEDTQNEAALNMRDRLDQSLVSLGNRILFFEIWFKDLPDSIAEKLIAQCGDLKYFLESIRRFKPYTLSEREEKLLALKDPNGIDALVSLYEMITNRFTFSLEVDGEKKGLTRDQLTSYYFNSSAQIRAAAYQELYRVYSENSTILAQIYSHRVRDWHAEGIELRGYSSPISARNLGNDLPDEVVDTLLTVCRKNAALFQRYFRLKADWLGVEKLRRYDIYAPLAKAEKKYDFTQAKIWCLKHSRNSPPKWQAWPSGYSTSSILIRRAGTVNVAAVFAMPSCLNLLPGCWSITMAGLATSPPWRTSWGMPCMPCWRQIIRFYPSMPRNPWLRLPRFSLRCN